MTMTMMYGTGPTGWYLITPEGGSSVAVCVDQSGRLCNMVEEAGAATHVEAGDALADIASVVLDPTDRTSWHVTAEHARAVVEAWDSEADPDMVEVERITGAADD